MLTYVSNWNDPTKDKESTQYNPRHNNRYSEPICGLDLYLQLSILVWDMIPCETKEIINAFERRNLYKPITKLSPGTGNYPQRKTFINLNGRNSNPTYHLTLSTVARVAMKHLLSMVIYCRRFFQMLDYRLFPTELNAFTERSNAFPQSQNCELLVFITSIITINHPSAI